MDGAIGAVLSQEGNVHPAILIAAMDALSSKGPVDRDMLFDLVGKSRSLDCMPSVRAAGIVLAQHDSKTAAELLSSSSRSPEVFNRSLMAAEILSAEGDKVNARTEALRAYGTDPTDDRVYAILMNVDPDGGWGERQNIQSILSGGRPENKVGTGRLQELYSIYYEWFRGSHDVATSCLISSEHYRSKDPEFLLASARISVDERDWRSACMVYDSILDSSPEFVIREAASAHLESGDVAGALAVLSNADRTFPDTMRLLIRAHRRAGDRTELMDCIRAFLDSEFSTFDDHSDMVRMLISDGMVDEARTVLDRLSSLFPRDPDVLTLRSMYLASYGNLSGALSESAKAVHFDQNCIHARVQRARMYHLTGKDDYASKECGNILKRDPGNHDALSLSRDLLFSKGDNAAAEDICRRLIDEDPSDTESMIVLARCIAASDDLSGAYDVLGRCLRADPGRDNSVRVAGTMIALGMNREAVSTCRELVRRFPDDSDILRLKGNAEYAVGDYMAASVSFASAAAASPNDAGIWHSKGLADEARGDLESAESAYDRAVMLDMRVPQHWISKSVLQELKGDTGGCIESLNRAIELDPRSFH
ncbi:MAG: tetratricopeptide repeat protein, partial [Candidatus Methanomethylophilaceae archaeon]